MGLINLLLKAVILLLDLRDTCDSLGTAKLEEIGRSERQVLVRNAEDGTKQTISRRRVGTSKRKAAVKSALTTVLVWNLFQKIEPLCDRTIAWFVPFYDSFKTLFLIWMLFTRSYGASILVSRIMVPVLKPYEPSIDGIVGLTLALFGSVAALLAPVVDRCAAFVRGTTSSMPQSARLVEAREASIAASSPSDKEPSSSRHTTTKSPASRNEKKPPPPSASTQAPKALTDSVAASLRAPQTAAQPRSVTTRARHMPVTKASQSNVAATRRVLQELPLPRHAFATTPTPPSVPLAHSSSASKSGSAAFNVLLTPTKDSMQPPAVKPEPLTPSLESSGAALRPTSVLDLGPPPTPPSDLRNYAFIPGQTPQEAASSSVISPTPRFPGGFSFSFAAAQASASTRNNPFQAQARVPITTQMAPLSLSSPLAKSGIPPHLLGPNVTVTSNLTTSEKRSPARDNRIVPPPNGAVGVRKVSSSRPLKGKVKEDEKQPGLKATASLSSKKRARSDEVAEGESGEGAQSNSANISPRKRAKAVNGKVPTSKTATLSAAAKGSAKAKTTSTGGKTDVAATDKAKLRKKTAVTGGQRATKKDAAPEPSNRTAESNLSTVAVDENPKAITAKSLRKKADSASAEGTAALYKSIAKRATAKKATASKARSQFVDTPEASEPPQRLTRSRTKQHLAD
ncbi:uncharacterized protein MEPE_01389 [Melanopsichium pennsylvanicum]|uniref:Uncharacterized protein n=2 Tax=Melanopsichium pennsylvanicum TaxID=63383 RepID=A0AAJ4XIE0_9BASI|nr:hypothetical protein BN887_03959 [Melanopsichium pennsylvanicum 4]SNX82683.1 uncharacterized protein MEPE_01389 [Melanopsichium pennsylvanicum]